MTKREFLRALAAGPLAAAGWPNVASRRPSRAPLKNWVWMRPRLGRAADDWKRDFALMRSSGIHALNVEIYNGREAYYRSRRFPVRADFLETIVPFARMEGIEIHAWMWTLPCLLPEILHAHPDWYNVNAKGESAADKPAYVDYYKFLDPARPEVREFVQGTVRELAQIDGLAGVHLDYVRHPDAILPSGLWSKYGIVQDKVYPAYDYGYTEYSRRAFKAAHGIDPIELRDPEANRDWLQYRLDSVVDLVNRYLVPAAHAGGKMITAAVFPGPSRARTMVRQDWGRFQIDAFLPMLYHRFYQAGPEFVREYTREAVGAVSKPVYSGVFVPDLDEDELRRTIAMALEGGARGISIFDAAAMTVPRWKIVAGALAQ